MTWSYWMSKSEPHSTQQPPITTENRFLHLRRDEHTARLTRQRLCGQDCTRALQLALSSTPLLVEKRMGIISRQVVVFPMEPSAEQPVLPPPASEDQHRPSFARGFEFRQVLSLQAGRAHILLSVAKDVPLPPRTNPYEARVLRLPHEGES
jgi:hypothetical protein